MNTDTSDHASFNWTIDDANTWPPRGRRHPPYGPTTMEEMLSCPVRTFFEASRGYERRMAYSGRIGNAYHAALETLLDDPPPTTSSADAAEEARRRFYSELAKQDTQAANRPRERGLPKDEARIARALEAIVLEAQQLARFAHHAHTVFSQAPRLQEVPEPATAEPASSDTLIPVEIEQQLRSADGMFQGRIDRIEHLPTGVRLVDTKTSLHDDVPERYEHQLQLYAYLWHDVHGEWPAEAELIYPLTATTHKVLIDRHTCDQLVTEYRALVERVEQEPLADKLATPGDVCKACEFRPWCRPFWSHQAAEKRYDLATDKARLGFEGELTTIEILNNHWKLIISWRDFPVKIIAPVERFPQLTGAQPGMRVRCLDMELRGDQFAPKAFVSEYSEIYLLTSPSTPRPFA